MENLTTDKLRQLGACVEAYKWVAQKEEQSYIDIIEKSIIEDHMDWANWLLLRILDPEQRLKYAKFASEQVYRKEINDKEVYEIACTARTIEEWSDVAVGYYKRAELGYSDSDYVDDTVNVVLKFCDKDKVILTKLIKYGIELLGESDGK